MARLAGHQGARVGGIGGIGGIGGSGDSGDSPTLSITGTRNRQRPFGVVPRVLGRHRMVPPLGAAPFTEIVGDDQYVRLLFVWGYGPLDLSDFRIGETPLSAFADVQAEHLAGWISDPPLTLFPKTVVEESLQILLKQSSSWTTRTTDPDADEISIDLSFLQGLVEFEADGTKKTRSVSVDIEYRVVGGGAWTPLTTTTVTGAKTSVMRTARRWAVARGRYEVRVRRTTVDSNDSKIFDLVTWTALRTFTNEDPVALPGLAKTVLRIRATDQLSGIVDTFNGVAHSILPDWDSPTQTWIQRTTSNPASIYREVLQGSANARALPDSRADLPNLQSWHDRCVALGLEFNMVRDFPASVFETLSDVAAAGQASVARRDGKWGVVVDEPNKARVQLFSPRNSFDYRGQRIFQDVPHGFRVRFANRNKDWRADEMIVFRDGFSAANATEFEGLDLIGVTDPQTVWRLGRYHLATALLRPEAHRFSTDLEYLVCQRGDVVGLNHDVILVGLASGRIKSVTTDVNGDVTAIDVDEALPMQAGKSYGLAIRTEPDVNLTAGVVTAAGEQTSITLTAPIPAAQAPAPGDLFVFGELGKESINVVVKSITPGQDGTARLTCLDYAPAVHDSDTGPIPPFQSNITDPPGALVPIVVSIQSDERVLVRETDGSLSVRIVVSLALVSNRPLERIAGIEPQIRRSDSGGPWRNDPLARRDAGEISILDVEQNVTYDIRLRFALRDGSVGPWTPVFAHRVIGKTSPPPDAETLLINGDVLSWRAPPLPLDFDGWQVRGHAGNNRHWETAAPLHSGLIAGPPFDIGARNAGVRTYMVKGVDTSGNESAQAAALVVDLGDPLVANVVETIDLAAQGFPGTLTNGSIVAGEALADADATQLWSGDDANPLWSGNDSNLMWGGGFLAMSYDFVVLPDSTVVPADLTIDAAVTGTSWSLLFRLAGSARLWSGDDTTPLWSGDDTAPLWEASGTFQTWPGLIEGATRQSYEFRLSTAAGRVRGKVSTLSAVLDVPDIEESFEDIALAAAGTRLPITKTYRKIKVVGGIALQDAGAAETVRVIDKSPTAGPMLRAFDAAGTGVAATIDAVIQGF
ncbi:MAG: host specificity factor TipJ family phage tail protein [Alphaproteobacteria bacterium]